MNIGEARDGEPRYSDLEGKCAVVVGGAGGIGSAIASELGRCGCRVAILDLPEAQASARSLAERLGAAGASAAAFECDVVSVASVGESFSAVHDQLGPPRIVVNSAGRIVRKPSLELAEEEWDGVVDVCLKGTFFVCQQAARYMARAGGGSIINVSSIFGIAGAPNRAAYAASKAAVIGLCRALAVEWAVHAIRVNAIAPAFVRTPMTERLLAAGLDVSNKTLLAPLVDLSDVSAAALYLASDRCSRMITGQVMAVDGGWTVW